MPSVIAIHYVVCDIIKIYHILYYLGSANLFLSYNLVACAELVKQTVYQPAAVLQQVGIRWIAYLGVAACGVNLHRTAVIVAGTIVTVPQTFVVFLLYPVPGKVVGQLDSTVGFAQSRK